MTSSPRVSPTMMRSGRILSALLQAVALGDGAAALDVGRAALHAADMGLLELELGGVLDGEDSLGVPDEGRQRVERGGLARSRAARDDDVETAGDRGLEIGRHGLGEGAESDQIVDAELLLLELADRDQRAVHGDGRHHGVEARAVLEARVDVGVRLVHAPADGRDDLVDDPHEVLLVAERHVRERQLARALDEDLAGPVDEDVVHVVVAQQGLQRAEPLHLVEELLSEAHALVAAEHHPHLLERFGRDGVDLGAQVRIGGALQRREVELVEEPHVQLGLDLREPLAALALLGVIDRHRRGLGEAAHRRLGERRRGGRGLGRRPGRGRGPGVAAVLGEHSRPPIAPPRRRRPRGCARAATWPGARSRA